MKKVSVRLDAEELEAIVIALSLAQRNPSLVVRLNEWTERALTNILNAKDKLNEITEKR